MVFIKGAREPAEQNSRIEFTIHRDMIDPGQIGPLTDFYVNLDSALRQDMLCHYSGTVSALYWIALCQHPEYGHMELIDLVDRSFPQVVQTLHANVTNLTSLSLVSLGPGDGEIDIRILRYLEQGFDVHCYYCLDFSFELLRYAVIRVSTSSVLKNSFRIRAVCGNFAASRDFFPRDEGVRLFTLTGFTLGNYNEADLLGKIGQLMTERDFLLVDAHLHDLKDWDGLCPVSKKEILHVLSSYSQEATNRFVFGPVEAATTASAADVKFDCRINREVTSVPNALNIAIMCKNLKTRMRFTGEAVERDQLDLASTTFYNHADLKKWFPIAGFQCVWEKQEGCIALFLLKRSVPVVPRDSIGADASDGTGM